VSLLLVLLPDRCQAVKASDGALQSGALQPGLLISYKKDDKHILALVEAPDGKKNWWIVDQVIILARLWSLCLCCNSSSSSRSLYSRSFKGVYTVIQ
jgi:hypothetical protein